MIVERLTFKAQYGQGDALAALFKEFMETHGKALGVTSGRMYTDLTGPMFTLQLEMEFEDLTSYAAFMAADQQLYTTQEFQDWFGKTVSLTKSGERQILNVTTYPA